MILNIQCITGVVLLSLVCGQDSVGDVCELQSSKSLGRCELFKNCPHAREGLLKRRKFPEICGFEGTEIIACCPSRKPGEISQKKCKEYASYVLKVELNTLFGMYTVYECEPVRGFVVGGTLAGRLQFPHMAAIGFEQAPGQVQWLCGGSILSEHYILTAAHCLSHNSQVATWVKLGVTNLNDTNHRQEIRVQHRIPHPDYRSSSHYHDIGLLKLESPITLNAYARPACLHLGEGPFPKQVRASGWGLTSWNGNSSIDLLEVKLEVFQHDFCNKSYRHQLSRKLNRGILDEIQVCAGSILREKDTCQGDSGGPIQVVHAGFGDNNCVYDIAGVTSFGKACSGGPGVYVRVSHYVKWIEDVVWPVD